MMHNKSLILGFVILLLVALGYSQKDINQIISFLQFPTPTTQPAKPSETLGANDDQAYLVTKVIDGDTIQIETGQKVRYIGIDTPELKGNECFAKEARDKNKTLVEEKRVKLQKDVSETDKYGRLLRFVYTEDGTFVNDVLVKEGFATIATYPPDVSKQDIFKKSQQDAINNNRGLWGSACKSPHS